LSDCQKNKKNKKNHSNSVSNGKCESILGDVVNDDKGEEGVDTSYYGNHVVTDQDMFDGCKVNIVCQV
jgi:hypothetical protein